MLARQCPPRTTLIRLTTKLGSRLRMIAVLTSINSASIGVELVGKPKPSAPWVSPAARMTNPAASHTGHDRINSGSMSERMAPVAGAEAEERLRCALAERDDLEQLAHFRGGEELLRLGGERCIRADVVRRRRSENFGDAAV